ncbi:MULTISPECIES: pyruvate formate-lyase-activating protein [unclassified Thermosynechococcus]|uniref:pyruvate formate-lyase-activating protein n=1 Tax=unclassified Thermosynechococcus TaxID=2622553 RepID=UPI001981D4C9|nr:MULTISPECIES: pyruvate formate-lyase-activating protein [unclassified Thermosynechococcus]MDR5638579.1 pyruvate formate-lyase-activating protein [Thermosynechococcus sp. PP42]MDR7899150.1 pyruvate formate-lyase-activating protein [Thermosynechococcus sp. JY1332]MDR7906557.1 pyruvate formate-lyase-activating protein [Thermosynechococcus sp. JY1334]MDR7921399.1 pyruvate formate-lyase-activating protein [Thermosynechococcus sp. HY213]MDR7994379.1 pyruvate formate-lyase-activating protein [Ther
MMVSILPEKQPEKQKVTGYIHSVETCGTVDGPGIRYVIFTQGCPLRCLYCHNPDCREPHQGKLVTVDELIADIQHYQSYLRQGGVTVSGGEPLMQPEFVREIFERCHELGLHTALDTSGYVVLEAAKPVVAATDLVLLDIKSFLPETYRRVTSVTITPTLELAKYLDEIHKPTWIRFVLVPGLTDDPENIRGLAQFVAGLRNVEKVEVLPFHKMGEYKWQQLGLPYELFDTPAASPKDVQRAIALFREYDLNVQ